VDGVDFGFYWGGLYISVIFRNIMYELYDYLCYQKSDNPPIIIVCFDLFDRKASRRLDRRKYYIVCSPT